MTLLDSGVFQKLVYGFGWVGVKLEPKLFKEGELDSWLLKD